MLQKNPTERYAEERRRIVKAMVAGTAGSFLAAHAIGRAAAAAAERQAVPANPAEAIAALEAGNARYTGHQPRVRSVEQIEEIWTETPQGQAPFATVLGCADSRLAPEIIFDQFIGDIFVVREAGNIADSPTNLGSLEFGHAVLGSKAILVLGHGACGAVKAAFAGDKPGGNIQSIVDAIKPGIQGAKSLDDAIRDNVKAVIEGIRAKSPLLAAAEKAGKITVAGGIYTLETGAVTFL
jgi:carbonic anhydrase